MGDTIATLTGALFVLLSIVPAGGCSEVPSLSSSYSGCCTAWATSSSSALAAAPDLIKPYEARAFEGGLAHWTAANLPALVF
jgi:hypothetical protein